MSTEELMEWKDATIEIIVGKETKAVPGATFDWAPGLAITMSVFGYFGITHINSKHKVLAHTQRFEQAVLDLSRLAMIAKSCGFSWADGGTELGAQIFEHHGEKEVPFEGATITSSQGVRKQTIKDWIVANSRSWPEFPWEEESPFDAAARNVELIMSEAKSS